MINKMKFVASCPGCGKGFEMEYPGSIIVIAESEQRVEIRDFLEVEEGCKNPFCKWSCIHID